MRQKGRVGVPATALAVIMAASSVTAIATAAAAESSPALTVNLNSLAFGKVPALTSSTKTLKLTNSSAADLSEVVAIDPASGNAADFAVADRATATGCGGVVAAGKSCSVTVDFRPTAAGLRTARLDVFNSSGSIVNAVALSGTGLKAKAAQAANPASEGLPPTLFPLAINLGVQAVGTTGNPHTIVLANNQNAPLTISGITISNEQFAETDNCSEVGPYAHCAIEVTFTPTAAGDQTGTLTVNDGFVGSAMYPQSVQLAGLGSGSGQADPNPTATPGPGGAARGLPPTLFPMVVNLGSQAIGTTGDPRTIILTNNQDAPLTISGITISNDQFAETDNCASVAPFGHCAIDVTFTPTATGNQTGTLNLNDGFTVTPLYPQSAQLVGRGLGSASPNPTATPGSGGGSGGLPPSLFPLVVNLGTQAVGTTGSAHTIELTNNQNAPLSISGITISNDQFAETDDCASVAPFGHCAIDVTFSPTATGDQTGTLNLNDGFATTPKYPQSVQLAGLGAGSSAAGPAPTATPGAGGTQAGLPPKLFPLVLNLGAQAVGTTGSAHMIVLTNSQNAPLSISGITISNDQFAETDDCASVAPFAHCTIEVTFSPTASGDQTGELVVDDGFAGTPLYPQSVQLVGRGTGGS
ncbi:MAG: choice-of-anchor D domain-containing protein [Candidatus Binatales bacterium]